MERVISRLSSLFRHILGKMRNLRGLMKKVAQLFFAHDVRTVHRATYSNCKRK